MEYSFGPFLPKLSPFRQESQLGHHPGMFGRELLTGLELHAGLGVEGLGFEFPLHVFFMRRKPDTPDKVVI